MSSKLKHESSSGEKGENSEYCCEKLEEEAVCRPREMAHTTIELRFDCFLPVTLWMVKSRVSEPDNFSQNNCDWKCLNSINSAYRQRSHNCAVVFETWLEKLSRLRKDISVTYRHLDLYSVIRLNVALQTNMPTYGMCILQPLPQAGMCSLSAPSPRLPCVSTLLPPGCHVYLRPLPPAAMSILSGPFPWLPYVSP
jgi:hypothetical protein